MKIFLISLVISFSYFTCSLAQADIKTTCGKQKASTHAYDYCVRTNSESRAVIYFFHGILGNESSYHKVITAYLDPLWEKKGVPLPNIINVSFGGTWLLSEAAGGKQYYKTFSEEAQPFLEQTFKFDSSYHKIVMGMSMGGFNAAQAFAKSPYQYEKAAFLCPALHTIGPYASKEELDAFIKRTKAQRQLVNLSQEIGQSEFVNSQAWDSESPFAVTGKMPVIDVPVFIAVGDSDQFGFQEGAQSYSELMKAKTSAGVDFHLIKDGGHCSYPSQALADFLESSLH